MNEIRLNFYKRELRKVNKRIKNGTYYQTTLTYKEWLQKRIKELTQIENMKLKGGCEICLK